MYLGVKAEEYSVNHGMMDETLQIDSAKAVPSPTHGYADGLIRQHGTSRRNRLFCQMMLD